MSLKLRRQRADNIGTQLTSDCDIVVSSYPEMYCLFASSLIVLDIDSCEGSDCVLRFLCNAMGSIDYCIDAYTEVDKRLVLERAITKFLLDETLADDNTYLKTFGFYNDLHGLRHCIPRDTRMEVVRITQRLFRRSECDRVTRSQARIVASKIRQGRLTSELTLAAIGVENESFRNIATLFGIAGSLLDSLCDSKRDFANGEVGVTPTFGLYVLFLHRLLRELSKLAYLLGPISLCRIITNSILILVQVTRHRRRMRKLSVHLNDKLGANEL